MKLRQWLHLVPLPIAASIGLAVQVASMVVGIMRILLFDWWLGDPYRSKSDALHQTDTSS